MAVRRETIGQQIKRITRVKRHRDLDTGMLYNKRSELITKRKKITLIGLFVSDEKTFLVRPHLFSSTTLRNARQWEAWLRDNYGTILPNILEGMSNHTDKSWRLYRIIGWMPDDTTRLIHARSHKKRNKTK